MTWLDAQASVAAKPVACFADRSNDVALECRQVFKLNCFNNLVIRLVHGGSGNVIHCCVDYAEVLLFSGLEMQHFCQTDACVADERAAWLNHDLAVTMASLINTGKQCLYECFGCWRVFSIVVDTKAASNVNVLDVDSVLLDFFNEVKDTVQGIEVWFNACDLRPNVAIYTNHIQPWQAGSVLEDLNSAVVRNSKLVFLQPSRNIGVRLGINVGIHTDAHRGLRFKVKSGLIEQLQFCLAFDIEATDILH